MRLALEKIQRGLALPTKPVATSRATTAPGRVCFFGNFGTQNLGNELTLQAMLQGARAHLRDGRFSCVCTNAVSTAAAYDIAAVGISSRRGFASPSLNVRREGRVRRFVRLALVGVPLELRDWARAFRALNATTMLVMTGTGMLSDDGIGPLDLHYEILKWSILAKLRGCKLLFVSVGVGPIVHPLSRWIVKAVLALADYRSYRDWFSQRYLESIGFDSSKDRVYPDLAFSVASSPGVASRQQQAGALVVALGLMDYHGQHATPVEGERFYRRYVEGMARFTSWLLANGYTVQLLIGDLDYDRRVKHDVLNAMEASGEAFERDRVIDVAISSPEQLDEQIERSDFVVAARFHNVVLALLRNRPVIALTHHEKVRALMTEAGLEDYCEDVPTLDVERLIATFKRLEANAGAFRSSISTKTERYRAALDEQYVRIFGGGPAA